jgi:hypothetical protein
LLEPFRIRQRTGGVASTVVAKRVFLEVVAVSPQRNYRRNRLNFSVSVMSIGRFSGANDRLQLSFLLEQHVLVQQVA